MIDRRGRGEGGRGGRGEENDVEMKMRLTAVTAGQTAGEELIVNDIVQQSSHINSDQVEIFPAL